MVGDWLTAAVSASAPLSRAMPPWQSANRGNAWELREGQWVDVSADFQGMSEGEMTELGSELIVVGYACSMVLKQGRNFDRKKPDCASFRGPAWCASACEARNTDCGLAHAHAPMPTAGALARVMYGAPPAEHLLPSFALHHLHQPGQRACCNGERYERLVPKPHNLRGDAPRGPAHQGGVLLLRFERSPPPATSQGGRAGLGARPARPRPTRRLCFLRCEKRPRDMFVLGRSWLTDCSPNRDIPQIMRRGAVTTGAPGEKTVVALPNTPKTGPMLSGAHGRALLTLHPAHELSV